MPNKLKFRHHGFTLIEIMVVIVIIGILASLVVPRIMDEPDKAKVTAARVQIKQLESTLNLYRLHNGFYPSTDQGLEALVQKPAGSPEPRNYQQGGYLPRLPQDPWGYPYLYLQPGRHGAIDIWSQGADGQPGGEGFNADIGNWDLGQQ